MSRLTTEHTVALTGATGFTGRVVTRQLIALGCKLRIIARASSDTREFEAHPNVEIVRGDVSDKDVINRACAGCHYIIHMATIFREKGISEAQFRDVHVVSTQLLAHAAANEPGFHRFVLVSTVGVHGRIDVPRANEEYRLSPIDTYQQTKAEAELWIREFAATKQLQLSVLRPVAIMGPGDKRLLKMFRMAKLPLIPRVGKSTGLYHLIHVEDLARCIIAATDSRLPSRGVYIIGNREPSSAHEIISETAKLLGRKARFLHLPAWPFWLLALATEGVCRPLRVPPPLRRRHITTLSHNRAFDTSRMHEVFGDLMQYDNRSGLQDTLEWYRQQKLL